ncbi:MAG: GumC family protein [Gammaproteobacteria bacterium]
MWLVLGVFLLGLALTLTFVWSLPPLYQASATLVVANSAELGNGSNSSTGNFGGIDPPPLDAVTQQVLGRKNLAGIISRLNLYPEARKQASTQSLIERLRKNISIEKEQISNSYGRPQTLGFHLNYSNGNPDTAAAVANELAKSYQTTARQIRLVQARANATALSASMAVVSAKLAQQQKKIEQFNSENLGALPQQEQVNLASLSHLYSQLQADQSGELNAINRRASLLEHTSNAGNGDNSGDLSLAQLKQKLRDLKLRYTDQYPDVIALKRRIAALEGQPKTGESGSGQASSLQGQLNDVNIELRQFQANEKKTQAKIAKAKHQLAKLPITGQRFETLNQGATQINGVYATLLKQYEQARVVAATADKGAPPYTITEPALVPTTSLGPKRLRYAVMLIILCAVLTFGAVMIAEKRDTTFHTLDELREFTSVPILATVPFIRRRRDGLLRFAKTGSLVIALVCGMAILGGIGYIAGHGNQAMTQTLSSHAEATQ